VLLLSGAGSGIGRAVCQVLAREGAKVIAADQNGMAAQETKGLISGKTEMTQVVVLKWSLLNLLSVLYK
jgi:NAD(P)-dependent dehydrogenase (short-subunit alcohol dehydrogenase family)